MHHILPLSLALLATLAPLACGGDSYRSVTEETLAVLEEVADTLAGVDDVAAAE
ncbi:MAG TPA: hypothetical protein VGC54_03605 [Planctomycetota bacterium]